MAPAQRTPTALTDVKVKAFVAKAVKGSKLLDDGGLRLLISPAGTPIWRVKYRAPGKAEKTSYTIGNYPDVSLAAARAARAEVKAHLSAGRDPVQERRVERVAAVVNSANTFAEVAAQWLAAESKGWKPIHLGKAKRALERDVLPVLGALPVADIESVMITSVIETILERKNRRNGSVRETASKLLQHMGSIFDLAIARGMRKDNPATPVQVILPKAVRSVGRAAFLTFPELGDVLRRAEAAPISPAVRMASRLCAFTAQRIGNIVEAEWSEFDLESDVPTWIIPRRKMKAQDRPLDHKVVLCARIVEQLRQWRGIVGSEGYLFASPIERKSGKNHITAEAVAKAYRETLGLMDKHSPHGWRAAFSTLANDDEAGNFEDDCIELTLDHVHSSKVVQAYDRGIRLGWRIKLMTWWGSELARAESGANVVPLRKAQSKK